MQKLYQKHGKEALDVVFAPEQWQPSPVIIKVVNPEDLRSRRFVLVWNNKGQDHKSCPIYHHMVDKEMAAKTDGGNPARVKVPGLHEGEAEKDKVFVRWEDKESREDGISTHLFQDWLTKRSFTQVWHFSQLRCSF